jgi:hypothetical protein
MQLISTEGWVTFIRFRVIRRLASLLSSAAKCRVRGGVRPEDLHCDNVLAGRPCRTPDKYGRLAAS